MVSENPSLLTLDALVEYISRGHALDKHALGYDRTSGMQGINAFRAEETNAYYDEGKDKFIPPQGLGDDLFIETPDDLADYIKNRFLTSPDTSGYVDVGDNSVNLYNSKDNTALHFSWKNKERDLGTIYRYSQTPIRFATLQKNAEDYASVLDVELPKFDNADDPGAAKNAVEALIADMNTNPQNYLFNDNNPQSNVQNRVLNAIARPGRTPDHDEVWNALNNVKGHSKDYSKHHGLDIPAEDCVCIKQASEQEFNVGRVRKSLRSGRVHREVGELGIDFDVEVQPALA